MNHPEKSAISVLSDAVIDEIWEAQAAQYGQVCDSEDFRIFARTIARHVTESAAIQPAGEVITDPKAKGYRPPCCDGGGEGSACCDSGEGCVANRELAEMRLVAPTTQPTADVSAPRDERAYNEAANLAKAIYSQHYRLSARDWRVLPDICGVISQISNMVAGMTRARAAAPVSGQGASELPPVPPGRRMRGGHTDEQMREYGQLCRDTASGTRAASGSIADDEGFQVLLANYYLSDEDTEAMEIEREIIAFIDARQPVAAPSNALALAENECWCGGVAIALKSAAPVAPEQAVTDADRWEWMVDTFGQTALPCFLEHHFERGYIADGKASIDAVVDQAILAKRNGGAA